MPRQLLQVDLFCVQGQNPILHSCPFPAGDTEKVWHGSGRSSSWPRSRRGGISPASASDPRKEQRRVTGGVTGESVVRMGDRRGHVQVDDSGRALWMNWHLMGLQRVGRICTFKEGKWEGELLRSSF